MMGLIILCFILGITLFFVWRTLGILYFRRYIAWETENRRGLHYYGRPLALRKKFKDKLKRNAFFLLPLMKFEASLKRSNKNARPFIPSFVYQNVSGPSYSATPESFQAAAVYKPGPEDIFVSTQMKCGTTWMQQVVYEILYRGRGNLTDTGHKHMY